MQNLKLWHSKPINMPAIHPEGKQRATTLRPMMRIVALNTKGGCGKTTLCTNLAGYYASHGFETALLDADIQASSLLWLKNRGDKATAITGIAGSERNSRVTRSFQIRVPAGTERLIVDTPAALDSLHLQEFTRNADAILIPVLPSDIDIHAASRCIAELLLTGRIKRRAERVAVVANRVKKNTLIYEKLQHFLQGLEIPFVTSLRDTQNYVYASEIGLSIHELEERKTLQDMQDWDALIQWLEQRQLPVHGSSLLDTVTRPVIDQPDG